MGKAITLDVNGIQANLNMDYDPSADAFKGILTIDRPGATPFTTALSVNMAEIRNQVKAILSNRAGWSFSGVVKAMRRISARVAIKRMVRDVHAILNDPKFRTIMALSATIYPPLGMTYAQIQRADRLVRLARTNENAEAKVARIKEAADNGDPDALKLLRAMRGIYVAHKLGASVPAKVAGWWFNRQYRGPLAAKLEMSPFDKLRWLTSQGLETEKRVQRVDLLSLIRR